MGGRGKCDTNCLKDKIVNQSWHSLFQLVPLFNVERFVDPKHIGVKYPPFNNLFSISLWPFRLTEFTLS